MRTGAGQGIECTQTAQTAVAIGIWHGSIKNLAAYVAMVPAECLTGLRPALNHGYAGREIDEVQEVRVRLWKRVISGYLLIQHVLNGAIRDAGSQRRCSDSGGAFETAVLNWKSRYIVF